MKLYLTKEGLIDKGTVEWLEENENIPEISGEPVVQLRSLFDNSKTTVLVYRDLTLVQFWEFLLRLLEVTTGLRSCTFSNYAELMKELKEIKSVLLHWMFTENHLLSIKGFDYTMMNPEKMSTNNLFRTKACYIWKIIESNPFLDLKIKKSEIKRSSASDIDILFQYIRDSCMGDTDELVVYCMDFIKSKWITDHHIALATVSRRAYDPRMIVDIDKNEAWRQLFPTFFDEPGKSLKTFYNAFMNYCILFFIEDYLQLRTDHIQIIPHTQPFYYVRGPDGTVAADVLYFYGIDFFKERIDHMKEIHKNSS